VGLPGGFGSSELRSLPPNVKAAAISFFLLSLLALPVRGAAVECREGSSLLREKMHLTSTSGAAWDEGEELAGCQRISRLLCGCLS
jgi:hypothetical protein